MRKRWERFLGYGTLGAATVLAVTLSACTCHGPVKPGPGPEPINPPPPVQQCQPYKKGLVLQIEKAPSRVVSVAWMADGSRYATVNGEGLILVRERATGVVQKRYVLEKPDRIYSLVFSPKTSLLLGAVGAAGIRTWKESGVSPSFLPPKAGLSAESVATGVFGSSEFFVAGYRAQDGTGYLSWHSLDRDNPVIAARKEIATAVTRVAISRDGAITAAGLADGSILLYDTQTAELLFKTNPQPNAAVRSLGFQSKGQYLVASHDKTFRIWGLPKDLNASQPTLLVTDNSHRFTINDMKFSPDDLFLAAVTGEASDSKHGEFRFWRIDALASKRLIELPSPGSFEPLSIWSLAWQPNAKLSTLLYGAAKGSSRMWVVDALPEHTVTVSVNSPLTSIDYSASDHTYLYGSSDGKLFIFENFGDRRKPIKDLKSPIIHTEWDLDTGHAIALTKDGVMHSYHWEKDELVSSSPLGQTPTSFSLRRDGKSSAIALSNGSIAIMPPAPYKQPPTFVQNAHEGGVMAVRWSHDGSKLASAGRDGTLKLWKVSTDGKTLTLSDTYKLPAGQEPTMLRFNKGDARLAVGMTGGYLGLWQQFPKAWKVHQTKYPTSVVEWQNVRDEALVTAGTNGSKNYGLHLWSAPSPETLRHVFELLDPKHKHTQPITGLSMNVNDSSILSSSSDGTWRMWKLRRAYSIQAVSYASSPIGLVSRPNAAQLYVGTTNTYLHQFKLNASPAPTLRLTQAHDQAIPHMALSANGKQLLTAAHDGRVHVWDLTSQEPKKLRTFPDEKSSFSPVKRFTGMAFNHDQRFIAVGGFSTEASIDNGQLIFWDANNTTKPLQVFDKLQRVKSIAWHPTKNILLTGHQLRGVRVWELANGKFTNTRTIDIAHSLGTEQISFDRTGTHIATTSRYGDIRITRFADGKQVTRLDSAGSYVGNMLFHPNGKSIAISLNNGQIGIWRVSDGKLLRRLVDPDAVKPGFPYLAHQNGVSAMAWSSLENVIFTGGGDLKIKQWTCAK